ncbi:hypothetical protein PAECIP111802_05260 [Paenibacillus allorhizosphaerae]|uniref:Uncharacterized protein n=1 Tax=Paenibacillus allorhizosphaerae TaxID=2849866 RepID=A0ABM8VP97_9BACL|nr:hypothetical protein PAECIP111802_05260 [Paenibacillus allorhizosphaerae]
MGNPGIPCLPIMWLVKEYHPFIFQTGANLINLIHFKSE